MNYIKIIDDVYKSCCMSSHDVPLLSARIGEKSKAKILSKLEKLLRGHSEALTKSQIRSDELTRREKFLVNYLWQEVCVDNPDSTEKCMLCGGIYPPGCNDKSVCFIIFC